jgi:DNA primase
MDGYNSPILGFVARSWESEAAVPYLYPKGMQRAELLYASTTSYQLHKEAPIVLVEGVFDALAVFPNGVAVLGKPSQWQVNKLIAENIPVAVCLDGDALDEGWSLALVLRVHGVRAGAIWLPPAKDPDEFPRDVIMKAARQCIDAPEPVRIEWP